MPDYIDREKLIESIENDCQEQVYYTKEDAIDCIKSAISENVMQVVYGKWIIPHWRNSTSCADCSVCGETAGHYDYRGVQEHYKFCPYCGAKITRDN